MEEAMETGEALLESKLWKIEWGSAARWHGRGPPTPWHFAKSCIWQAQLIEKPPKNTQRSSCS